MKLPDFRVGWRGGPNCGWCPKWDTFLGVVSLHTCDVVNDQVMSIELGFEGTQICEGRKKTTHIFDVRNVEFNLFVALHCCHFVVQHGVHCALFGQVNGSVSQRVLED